MSEPLIEADHAGQAVEFRPHDRQWGYTFGCDGLLTIDQVQEVLPVSRKTIYRLCADRLLRKGKNPQHDPRSSGAVFICRRSLSEYVRSMEVGTDDQT